MQTIQSGSEAQFVAKQLKMVQYLRVDAVRVENGAVVLLDADAGGAGSVEVPHRVQTDITKTLQVKFVKTERHKKIQILT